MKEMTVQQLHEKLSSKEFQNPENGDLFYNYFVFQYDASKEHEMRQQIKEFKENFKRPTNYVDILTLDLFAEFCNYLNRISFGRHPSYLNYLLEKDGSDHDAVLKNLTIKANQQQFYEYIHNRIMEHVSIEDELIRPYVFVYGIGDMYPHLRTNNFLTNYEQFNKTSKYKLIVFYPGHVEGNNYSLFDALHDEHTYRATLLLNE
jgi:hypothetical protein